MTEFGFLAAFYLIAIWRQRFKDEACPSKSRNSESALRPWSRRPQRPAWLGGNWDLTVGQFFTSFRREVHVVADFDETRAREWFPALGYGFAHYTVFLLGCTDADGNRFVVDGHAERLWLPQRHAHAIHSLLTRHGPSASILAALHPTFCTTGLNAPKNAHNAEAMVC